MMKLFLNSYLFLKKYIYIFFWISIGFYSAGWVVPLASFSECKNAQPKMSKADGAQTPARQRITYVANYSAFLEINATTEVRNGKVPYLSPTYYIPVKVEKMFFKIGKKLCFFFCHAYAQYHVR